MTTPRVAVASLTVPTCNRPEGLERALESYLRNGADFGRKTRVVIADDSRDKNVQARYQRSLAGLARKFGASIYYLGAEEKIRFAKRLMDHGKIPAEIVKFALFDPFRSGLATTGANRNMLLLATVGETTVSVDDDTVCKIIKPPGASSDPVLGTIDDFSTSHPSEIWTYPDRKTLLESLPYAHEDFLALHETLLGREFELPPAGAAEFETAGATGRVTITFNGLAGDCVWTPQSGYLLLDEKSFQRITPDNETYRAALKTREVLRTVSEPVLIRKTMNQPSLFMGIDNRDICLPWMPVGRSQDFVYWHCFTPCFGGHYFGYLPGALLHLPVDTRSFVSGEMVRGSAIDMAYLFSLLIERADFVAGDERHNLQALGECLRRFAALSPEAFDGLVKESLKPRLDALVQRLELRLAQLGNAGLDCAAHIERYLEGVRQTFASPECGVPLDVLYGRDLSAAREFTQRFVDHFGRLLTWWPQIIHTTARLRAEGIVPGTPMAERV